MATITADRLRELLRYDPETGVFTWLADRTGDVKAGSSAGSISGSTGYRLIMLDGRNYREHRLAWLFVHGEWPVSSLDHINRVRGDNRIANLRSATPAQNLANSKRRSDNTSGLKGVSPKRGKWQARIKIDGHHYCLGSFVRPEEAHAAYMAAARKHYGSFAHAGEA